MFNLRFNQVFVGLLCLSFLCAFILPSDVTNRLRGVQALFSPVSWPARKLGSALRNRLDPPQSKDNRAESDVKRENAELRTTVANQAGQIEEMQRINQEYEGLGEVRSLCTRFHVDGNDPSTARDSLSIPATTFDGVERGMPVIYSVGIVGRIDHVTPGGAQVQLITDPKFGASARFCRFVAGKLRMLQTAQPFVSGAGHGLMQIKNIPLRDTRGNDPTDPEAGITVGDLVVLDDPAWPLNLKGRALGEVESIGQQVSAPTTAMIRVRPVL